MNLRNKKGQTNGLITGLVFGVASLVIGTIIAFVIVSTLDDADLLSGGRDTTTVTNETGASINSTGYSLAGLTSTGINSTITITNAWNNTDGSTIVVSGNITLSNGVITNATAISWDNVNVSYTFDEYSDEELSTDDMIGNFTSGVNNVSEKLPTVLLVAAIVLILGVLALLVGVWQRMNMGGGSTL